MEIDHIFVCVARSAESADLLSDFGLSEGTANRHRGQGTANRRFFFNNAFIEFLYLVDSKEAQSVLTSPTNLYERLSSTTDQVSPFGVCFRPSVKGESFAFPAWSYRPEYLPAGFDVFIAHAPSCEPLWFYLDFATRPDTAQPENRQVTAHRCGFKEISSVKVSSPTLGEFSEVVVAANAIEAFEFVQGAEHLVEVGFDSERAGEMKDFRPALPLIFKW